MNSKIKIFILMSLFTGIWGCATITPIEKARAQLKANNISFDRESFIKVSKDGNLKMVELFIEAGMSPKIMIEDEEVGAMSPLFASLMEGHNDISILLIEKGATENEFVGQLGLLLAVTMGNAEVTKQLLAKGVKSKMPHDKGVTLLMIACGAEKEALLDGDYSPDDEEMRQYINSDVVKLLLENGANVKQKDKKGCSALSYACLFGRKDLAELLLNAGAKIENNIVVENPDIGKIEGMPTLVAASSSGNVELVEMLIGKGADVNSAGSWMFALMFPPSFKYVGEGEGKGFTALHSACYAGRKNIVEYLLKKGADINAKDANGKTPIMFIRGKNMGINALWFKSEKDRDNDPIELVKLLVDGGAETDKDLFFKSIKKGYIETVTFLLDKGIPINSLDEKGLTPLMLAGKYKHQDLYDFLIKKGAKTELKSKERKTAKNYLNDKSVRNYGGLLMPTRYVGALVKPTKTLDFKKHKDANIIDGVGIKDIFVGKSTKADVVSTFGKESQLVEYKGYSYKMIYKNLGLSFYYGYNDPKEVITSISITPPFKGKTSGGIFLGESTMQDVESIYGKSHWSMTKEGKTYWYEHSGIHFHVEKDPDIGAPSEEGNKKHYMKKKIIRIDVEK